MKDHRKSEETKTKEDFQHQNFVTPKNKIKKTKT